MVGTAGDCHGEEAAPTKQSIAGTTSFALDGFAPLAMTIPTREAVMPCRAPAARAAFGDKGVTPRAPSRRCGGGARVAPAPRHRCRGGGDRRRHSRWIRRG